MNITAQTTEAQILQNVEDAKATLVTAAKKAALSSNIAGEALVRAAQEVRNAEAVATQQIRYLRMLQRQAKLAENGEPDPFEVEHQKDYLFDMISCGADDTWSGRMNDSARAAHEAVLVWVQRQMEEVKYKAERNRK